MKNIYHVFEQFFYFSRIFITNKEDKYSLQKIQEILQILYRAMKDETHLLPTSYKIHKKKRHNFFFNIHLLLFFLLEKYYSFVLE